MILDEAIGWAKAEGADMLIVESAGLCLRCTPYTTQSFGIVVLSAISGIQSPAKMAPMIALADIAVVTRIDLVSQAEKEVFREKIRGIRGDIDIVETNAVQGTGMRYLTKGDWGCTGYYRPCRYYPAGNTAAWCMYGLYWKDQYRVEASHRRPPAA
jgi:Ni2+-binding GTPase involved in maturation of urease and hydrogenase